MSQLPQQGYVPSKIQEFNRRASQELSNPPVLQGGSPRRDQIVNSKDGSPQRAQDQKQQNIQEQKETQKQLQEQYKSTAAAIAAHLQQHYGSPKSTHFEMGPRGVEYSPHRSSYAQEHRGPRDPGPQRSASIHGHELADSPVKGQDFYHRQQMAQGRMSAAAYHEVFMRHEYYPQIGHPGFSPPRPSRFSSQEYLNSPRGQEAYPGRMLAEYGGARSHEYRQRRRSSQDLQSVGHEPPIPGIFIY